MKVNDTLYFLNYSNSNTIRATDVAMFKTVDDVEAFKKSEADAGRSLFGYVVFHKYDGNDVVEAGVLEYIGGFQPSAQEMLNIEKYTKLAS